MAKGDNKAPTHRLVIPKENGKGGSNYVPLGVAWENEDEQTGSKSYGITLNLQSESVQFKDGQKLVLFEIKRDGREPGQD